MKRMNFKTAWIPLLFFLVMGGAPTAAVAFDCSCEEDATLSSSCDTCVVTWTGFTHAPGECFWLPTCTGQKSCSAFVKVHFQSIPPAQGTCNGLADLDLKVGCRGTGSAVQSCPAGNGTAELDLTCHNCVP